MLEGFYQVEFSADLPGVGGLAVLRDGTIVGGDNQMLYSGRYSVGDDESLIAQISVKAYVAGANSVFNTGAQTFKLSLKGKFSQSTFHLTGSSPTGQGPGITIRGTYVAPVEF